MTRILSGIQATGIPHLGNYLGALRHWVAVQDTAEECFFGVMNLHAITVPQDPVTLRANTRKTAAALLAIGLDGAKHAIFCQSDVRAHTELSWILSCHAQMGWLNRMTQFKEKAGKHKDTASLGLYSYPVLQAADILLYHATHVPVGEDQKQHLELCRDIAGAFNRATGEALFTLPEPMILGEATRVMSLRDGTKKMSKSDASDYARIQLDDSDDVIVQKIRKAKSDMLEGVTYAPEERPEASNLLRIYAALQGATIAQVQDECAALSFSEFKTRLTDVLIHHITPIRARLEQYLDDAPALDAVLQRSAERASQVADKTLADVKHAIGLSIR